MKENKLTMQGEDGEELTLYILEQTMLGGINYLLVTNDEDDTADDVEYAVMKEIGNSDTEEASYTFVTDDTELDSLGELFTAMMKENSKDI